MIFSSKGGFVTALVAVIGLIFLIFPLANDSYSHYLQNHTYERAHERVITCRAQIALQVVGEGLSPLSTGRSLEKMLDSSCGILPKYEDFIYDSQSGLISAYNWLAQRMTFIPL
jgi:hypothetical protein